MRSVPILVLVAVLAAVALAGKPGGNPPPADPAIAFLSSGNLAVMNEDGTNVTVLVTGLPSTATFSWSPDRSRIVLRDSDGLYIVNKDGTGLARIHEGDAYYPQWSPALAPDGNEKILFAESPDGVHGDLWLINVDGSGLRNLTDTSERSEHYGTWAPEADRIAAGSSDTTVLPREVRVYDLGLDAGGEVKITGEASVTGAGPLAGDFTFDFLDWARTGDRIAVSVWPTGAAVGERDLWIINLADPANPVNLTPNATFNDRWPTWAPDDSRLAFHRAGGGRRYDGIYVINANGSGLSLLKGGTNAAPAWRR